MKKLHFFILSVLLLNFTLNAQTDTINRFVQNDISFSRSMEKGQILALNDSKVRGSRSISSTESVESIFYHETYEYDTELDVEKLLMQGDVRNFKISTEFVPLTGDDDQLVSKFIY